MLVGAWFLQTLIPAPTVVTEPLPVTGAVGEAIHGRTFTITVTDAQVSDGVEGEQGWWAEGTWVVIDVQAEAEGSEAASPYLALATLTIDGVTYSASERPKSLLDASLSVDIPVAGSLAFEINPDLANGQATLRMGTTLSPVLDSIAQLHFNLADLERTDDRTIDSPAWAKP